MKKIKKLLGIAGILVVVIVAVIAIRAMLFPTKVVAIVHNNQNIGDIVYSLTDSNIAILEINTDYISTEDAIHDISLADGVIFAGGNDFDPEIYGGGDIDLVEDYSRSDDEKSLAIFDACVKEDKPMLNICRGMQLMNIYYGGSLYEDIPSQFADSIAHRGENKTMAYHDINIMDDSKLRHIVGAERIEVNSFHHEGIKDLAEGLRLAAISDDGIIEAIENPYQTYMLGVQWHPEKYDDEYSREIFKDFSRHLK